MAVIPGPVLTARGPAGRSQSRGAVLAAIALVAGAVGGPAPAGAGHGGIVQMSRIPAGPYALSVWTQASPRPGPWRVDVAVMQDGDRPVPDAAVRIRAEPVDGGAPVEVEARRDADPLGVRHRADVPLDRAGAWRVTVSVTGPAGAATTPAFPVDVAPVGWPWWPVAAGAAGAVVLAAWWRTRRRPAVAAAAGMAALAVLVVAATAWAHASLVRSSPARRATLTTAPDRVQLWFNEAVEPRFSTVSVWSQAGQQVDRADARVEPEDPKRLVVGVGTLAPGVYRVKFRVLSVDGHVVESEFPFTVR